MTEEQALQNFLLDIDCLDELKPWTDVFNIFDILKLSGDEAFHKNILAWLLDAKENHELGNTFFKLLLKKLVEHAGLERYDALRMEKCMTSDFAVYKDWEGMDILLVFREEQIIFVLENKVTSKERDQQLSHYRSVIEKDFPEYDKIFIFLSSDGALFGDVECWDTMTYEDIFYILEALEGDDRLSGDARVMLRNYKEIIRRDIVDDHQLMELCNKIYMKHKKALDLIYENRMDDKNIVGTIIKETLEKLSRDGRILFDPKQKSGQYIMFHTADMDAYLLPLDQPKSSFRTNRVYCYNFVVRDKTVCAGFEFGGFHVTDAHKETMKKILSLHKPNETLEDGFKFKPVLKTKTFDFSGVSNLEEAIRGVVEGFVEELMIMEAQLLFNLDNLDVYAQLEDDVWLTQEEFEDDEEE